MTDTQRDRDSNGYVGIRDHGSSRAAVPRDPRRAKSWVWGGKAVAILNEHGATAVWDPCFSQGGCCWYDYAADICMTGCVHPGIDVNLPVGTQLFAATDGTITYAGWDEVYYRPHHVDVVTDDGTLIVYAHLWSVAPGLASGGRVVAGQYIGDSGEQTHAGTMEPDGSGPHLHFECRSSNGCAVDPNPTLDAAPPSGTMHFTPAIEPFAASDLIRVVDGPLRLRSDASTDAAILTELANGTTVCVLEGPVARTEGAHDDALDWYRVRANADDGGTEGWLAGRYCTLAAKNGCAN